MAHFFKYANRVMHAGASKERDERNERLRKEGLKNHDNQGAEQTRRANMQLSHDVKERRLKDLAQAKMIREISKRSAVKKALDKNK